MKVLIVEEQTSNQFQLIDEIQNQLSLENKNIMIADNWLAACCFAERFCPDLIVMDVAVSDGFNATERILTKNPQTKIVMISNSDDDYLAQLSRKMGANAFLPKEQFSKKIKLVIEQISEEEIGFLNFNNPKMLATSEQEKVIENADKAFKIRTIVAQKVVEKWIYGQEVIQLKENEFLDCFDIFPNDREKIIQKILEGDTINCNLLDELNLRFENLADKQDRERYPEILEEVITQVERWFYKDNEKIFSCFQTRLEINAQKLRIDFNQQLKKFVSIFSNKAQPLPYLRYLEGIEMILKSAISNNHAELQELRKQERSAISAYNKLMQSDNSRQKIESLLRAILIEYQLKIQVEAINLANNCIQSLLRNINFYIDDLVQVNNLLVNAQDYLNVSSVDSMLSSFIEQKFLSLQDPINLLREIEREVGYSINHWGRQYHINPNYILEIIMRKTLDNSQIILEIMDNF